MVTNAIQLASEGLLDVEMSPVMRLVVGVGLVIFGAVLMVLANRFASKEREKAAARGADTAADGCAPELVRLIGILFALAGVGLVWQGLFG